MLDKNVAIKIQSISKRYRIGLKEDMHDNLTSSLLSLVRNPIQNYRKYRDLYDFSSNPLDENSEDVIWAVRDVSFDVKQGEVVGIIGTNGAGKSTLLKILAKITPPTLGRIEIRGRVSSLLEVGTGFNQELTGRENIYLNGTILGMRKREVDNKFDEIVDFSGVEKFLDTPVKRYSSGMRVRLAFAVAAHLEPEILIVDEVLAVGDAAFQKKCLNKMQDVGGEGRTILFVSHNMPAVTRLCERVVLLNKGGVIKDGNSHDVIKEYLNSGSGLANIKEWPEPKSAPGDNFVKLRSVKLVNKNYNLLTSANLSESVGIQMTFNVLQDGLILLPYFTVFNDEGIKVFTTIDESSSLEAQTRPAGKYVSTAWIPGNLLNEGFYYITVSMRSLEPMVKHFRRRDVVAFQYANKVNYDINECEYVGELGGVVRPKIKWETNFSSKVRY